MFTLIKYQEKGIQQNHMLKPTLYKRHANLLLLLLLFYYLNCIIYTIQTLTKEKTFPNRLKTDTEIVEGEV